MATMTGPTVDELRAELGAAMAAWNRIIEGVSKRLGPVEQEWKPSKSDFGMMCLLKLKKRTLIYMTPETDRIRIAVVLGERAVGIALERTLPDEVKKLIRDARPYAEGRGISFYINSPAEFSTVIELIDAKTTPK